MVNEGFLDFFKKSQPTDVVTQPVAQKVTEPKIIAPKKNVYADQFVKIFDKLNEMATKNGFKESKRYIEQESGLSHFVNYVVFEKGSRKIDIKYSWDKSLVVGKFNITVQDNGVDEYKIAKEVSQKEIPTVVGELFSKQDIELTKQKSKEVDVIKVDELIKIAEENDWSVKVDAPDDIKFFKKVGDKNRIVGLRTKMRLSGDSDETVSMLTINENRLVSVTMGDTFKFVSEILRNGKILKNYIITDEPIGQSVSGKSNVDYSDPTLTREKERSPRIKIKPTIEPKTEDAPKEKINPKEYYNKLFDFDLIQTTAINKGWKVDVEENKDTNKFDSILFTRGDEDIVVIPHEDKGNVTIETTKGSTNVEFKYVKKVLTDLIKNPLPKSTVPKPKLSTKEMFDKLSGFDLIHSTAVNKGWKVNVVSNEYGGYESITFDRGDDNLIKVIPQLTGDKVLIKTTKGSSNVDIKSVKKLLLVLIKTPLAKPTVPTKLKQVDYEKLFRFNEVTQIAKQAGWKQTIPVAPSSDTSNKYYAKFTKDSNEILFKPHDKTSGEEGRSSLLVNGKLSFLPYKDVYKKLTTLLNK